MNCSYVPLRRHAKVIMLCILSVSLAGCGGSGKVADTGVTTVSGQVTLPEGSSVPLGSLTVTTPLGAYPVSATGKFDADVFSGARTELGVETAANELLLLGISDGRTVNVSAATTAEALLYYAVGGMWLPADQQDRVRELLTGAAEAAPLATHLERQLVAGGNGLTSPDADLLAAIEAAHEAVLARADVAAFAQRAMSALAAQPTLSLQPADVFTSNIIVEPTTEQAGAKVLNNPAGAGVVAMNSFRRPAALLAYEVSWADADGVITDVDPPALAERVEVPSTGQLEFLNALLDVVTGASPWSPVTSPQLNLAGHQGASRTYYQLVLIGPSVVNTDRPIRSDPRFASFQPEWDEIVVDKSVDLFLGEMLLPLIEVYGLGSMAKLDAAKLNEMRARVRLLHDTHLAGLGVYLTAGQVGYANGLKYVIEELAKNDRFRLDLVDMVRDALELSDKNKAAIDAVEARLSARANASAIMAAVQAVLVGGDVSKIMLDLASAPSVVDWTAVSAPNLFALTPGSAKVSRHSSSAKFTILPKGNVRGNFLYRWTTSGTYGHLDDLLQQEAKSLVTDQRDVWYFHDAPLNIQNTDHDTITVEVFEVEAGATTIPSGAEPVARMGAEVNGDDRNIDDRIRIEYGVTGPGIYRDGIQYPCALMSLYFKPVPGAKSYTVLVRNAGGQGAKYNWNQDLRYRGRNHTIYFDPAAVKDGPNVPDGLVGRRSGPCDEDAFSGFERFYDPGRDEFSLAIFMFTEYYDIPSMDPIAVDQAVDLWYEWLKDATFEVVVGR